MQRQEVKEEHSMGAGLHGAENCDHVVGLGENKA